MARRAAPLALGRRLGDRRARPLGLGEHGRHSILGADVPINPSGGPLAANPIMATGLVRITEAAGAVRDGGKRRTLAHSTSGPCLQQNLVCILEGDTK